jgi:hypothetical protein
LILRFTPLLRQKTKGKKGVSELNSIQNKMASSNAQVIKKSKKIFHRVGASLFEADCESIPFDRSFRCDEAGWVEVANGGLERETGYDFQLGDIIVHQPAWREWNFYIIRRWTRKCMECRLLERTGYTEKGGKGYRYFYAPKIHPLRFVGKRKLFRFSKIKEDRDNQQKHSHILQRFHKYLWVYPRDIANNGDGPEWSIEPVGWPRYFDGRFPHPSNDNDES